MNPLFVSYLKQQQQNLYILSINNMCKLNNLMLVILVNIGHIELNKQEGLTLNITVNFPVIYNNKIPN